jgi:hypothetical protein
MDRVTIYSVKICIIQKYAIALRSLPKELKKSLIIKLLSGLILTKKMNKFIAIIIVTRSFSFVN